MNEPRLNADGTPRRARCTGYGASYRKTYEAHRTQKCGDDDLICRCEEDVPAEKPGERLAFFHAEPGEPFDSFYCGCSCGWD